MARTDEIPSKHPAAVVNGAISLVGLMEAAEVISGTPTIASTPSGLTFSNVAGSGSAISVKGASVPVGQALQFRVSGGESGVLYKCEATIVTNSTPAQTLVVEFRIFAIDH